MTKNTCKLKGLCQTSVTAICDKGLWLCNYSNVVEYEEIETCCDRFDNDCDGTVDDPESLVPPSSICEITNELGKCQGTYQCADSK